MALTAQSLLTLYPLEAVPACDEGMALAALYLNCWLHAVGALGRDQAEELHADSLRLWRNLSDYHESCDKCNEA